MRICIPLAMFWLLGCAPVLHEEPPTFDRWLTIQQQCKVAYPQHSSLETGWKTYRTYEVYHLALFKEMCLSWYALQQPKNHGILLSRGAPNF